MLMSPMAVRLTRAHCHLQQTAPHIPQYRSQGSRRIQDWDVWRPTWVRPPGGDNSWNKQDCPHLAPRPSCRPFSIIGL